MNTAIKFAFTGAALLAAHWVGTKIYEFATENTSVPANPIVKAGAQVLAMGAGAHLVSKVF